MIRSTSAPLTGCRLGVTTYGNRIGPGAVVAYVLTYSWTLWTPFAAEIWGDGGRVTMRATIAVRNEPF